VHGVHAGTVGCPGSGCRQRNREDAASVHARAGSLMPGAPVAVTLAVPPGQRHGLPWRGTEQQLRGDRPGMIMHYAPGESMLSFARVCFACRACAGVRCCSGWLSDGASGINSPENAPWEIFRRHRHWRPDDRRLPHGQRAPQWPADWGCPPACRRHGAWRALPPRRSGLRCAGRQEAGPHLPPRGLLHRGDSTQGLRAKRIQPVGSLFRPPENFPGRSRHLPEPGRFAGRRGAAEQCEGVVAGVRCQRSCRSQRGCVALWHRGLTASTRNRHPTPIRHDKPLRAVRRKAVQATGQGRLAARLRAVNA